MIGAKGVARPRNRISEGKCQLRHPKVGRIPQCRCEYCNKIWIVEQWARVVLRCDSAYLFDEIVCFLSLLFKEF